MTILVGILCQDGVVIGTDSSATFTDGQSRTIEQLVTKIDIVGDRIVIAHAGAGGHGQRFTIAVKKAWDKGRFKGLDFCDFGRELAKVGTDDFVYTDARPGSYGALVAYPADNAFHLCEFTIKEFQPEWKTDELCFASMGSGQLMADPFLGLMRKVFWPDGRPSLITGKFVVTWALQHAIELNSGGIQGPLQVAILSGKNPSARKLDPDELVEHQQSVEEAVRYLAKFPETEGGQDIPPPPTSDRASGGGRKE